MATAAEELIQRGKVLGRAEGEARGRAEGEARAILAVLDARGLAVTAEQRGTILTCRDVATLDRWVRRAATVKTAAELFAE